MQKENSVINHAADLVLVAGLSYREGERLLRAAMFGRALDRSSGNISRAAALLEIHRNHFTRELEKLGMRSLPQRIREERRVAARQLKLWKGMRMRSTRALFRMEISA